MISINFIVTWAHGIIISVIIATIIEMILPEGNSSKYIKMVIGVFVLFTIVSPLINKISGNKLSFDFGKDFSKDKNDILEVNANVNNDNLIIKTYEENLKIDIKAKILQKGYEISNLDVQIVNNDEYTINYIKAKIAKKTSSNNNENKYTTTTFIENIENVLVNVDGKKAEKKKEEKSVISESEKRKLRQYLSDVYGINEDCIYIY